MKFRLYEIRIFFLWELYAIKPHLKFMKSITDFWFSTIEIKLQTADYQLVKQRFQAKHLSIKSELITPQRGWVRATGTNRFAATLRRTSRVADEWRRNEAEACSSNVVAIPVCLNGSFVSVNLENLGTVTFGIFNLRNCKSINEAITSWALNYNFLKCKGVKNLSSEILNLVEIESLSNKLLTNPNSRFIPEKFLYKFQQVTKQTRPDPLKFMCLVNELYFWCKNTTQIG